MHSGEFHPLAEGAGSLRNQNQAEKSGPPTAETEGVRCFVMSNVRWWSANPAVGGFKY